MILQSLNQLIQHDKFLQLSKFLLSWEQVRRTKSTSWKKKWGHILNGEYNKKRYLHSQIFNSKSIGTSLLEMVSSELLNQRLIYHKKFWAVYLQTSKKMMMDSEKNQVHYSVMFSIYF